MIFGKHQQNTLDQFAEYRKSATKVALLSDGHMGVVCPVGSVWAHPSKISLNGIGPDAACGNCAVKTDVLLTDIHNIPIPIRLSEGLNNFANQIATTIHFGMGSIGCSDAPKDHELFDSPAWNIFPKHIRTPLKDRSRVVLSSCGSGNHYCDVFVDNAGFLWIGNHFGSRNLGYQLAKSFMALGQGLGWEDRPQEIETLLDINTQLGKDYWELLMLAGDYAYVGREWVARKVVSMIGGNVVDMVHNHHNFSWFETHDGQDLIVTRKGATPAFPGQRGFVGGSMGDNAVILRGAELDDDTIQKSTLFSTVHGAGRVMSRTEAMGKIDRKTGKLKINKETGEVSKPGKVTQEMLDQWMTKADVILRGSGLDEAPFAYRRLPDVLAEQGSTIVVEEVLKPIIVVMAGADEKDHYHIEG